MNRTNDGKAAEELVLAIADRYQRQGIMRLRKVGPPFRYYYNPKRGGMQTVFLDNPNADYVGLMTEIGGRMIECEVKSTRDDRLSIMTDSGGIKETQINAMFDWQAMGAICFMLWLNRDLSRMRFCTLREIMEAFKTRKHLKFDQDGQEVPAGKGFVRFDFAANIRKAFA